MTTILFSGMSLSEGITMDGGAPTTEESPIKQETSSVESNPLTDGNEADKFVDSNGRHRPIKEIKKCIRYAEQSVETSREHSRGNENGGIVPLYVQEDTLAYYRAELKLALAAQGSKK